MLSTKPSHFSNSKNSRNSRNSRNREINNKPRRQTQTCIFRHKNREESSNILHKIPPKVKKLSPQSLKNKNKPNPRPNINSNSNSNCNLKTNCNCNFNTNTRWTDIVAESLIENLSHDDRCALSGKHIESSIVLWNFDNPSLTTPMYLLECPLEITTFQFHPNNPYIVVAGAINGQLMVFNLQQEAHVKLKSIGKREKEATGDGNFLSLFLFLKAPTYKVQILSAIAESHHTYVSAIKFLPDCMSFVKKRGVAAKANDSKWVFKAFLKIK